MWGYLLNDSYTKAKPINLEFSKANSLLILKSQIPFLNTNSNEINILQKAAAFLLFYLYLQSLLFFNILDLFENAFRMTSLSLTFGEYNWA